MHNNHEILQQLIINNIIAMETEHISIVGVDCIKLFLEVFQVSAFLLTLIKFSGYITKGDFFNT